MKWIIITAGSVYFFSPETTQTGEMFYLATLFLFCRCFFIGSTKSDLKSDLQHLRQLYH